MKTSPVSFGSLMCFTINDGKPKASIPSMLNIAFSCNPKLSGYNLEKDVVQFNEGAVDGTVHNAAADFCEKLDKKYKDMLPKGSNKVIITEADFYVNPRTTEKRYFLTAPCADDENKILKALGVSNNFYTAKFREKNW